LENIKCNNIQELPALKGLSLKINSGEIVGVAGVEGNGQHELVEIIMGLWPVTSGRIILQGKDITEESVLKRREFGMAYIPEDRIKLGLCLPMSVAENLIMSYHRKKNLSWNKLILRSKSIKQFVKKLIKNFKILTPNPNNIAEKLSGGNLQRVVLAREFASKPKLLIASQPTRGLDMGAIEFIHKRLIKHRDEGCAILLVSADLQEILNLSDRIVVLYEGKIINEIPAKQADEQQLGRWMLGLQ